jgi:hypothetical protein
VVYVGNDGEIAQEAGVHDAFKTKVLLRK